MAEGDYRTISVFDRNPESGEDSYIDVRYRENADGSFSPVTHPDTVGAAGQTDGLTDEELRATPVPVSSDALTDEELRATAVPVSTDGLTDEELRATAVPVSSDALTDEELRATPVPVSLPSETVTTLTPPAALTNFANETGGNLAAIKAKTDNIPTSPAQDGTDITAPIAMPAGGTGIRGWLSAIWTKLNSALSVTPTATEVHLGQTGGQINIQSVEFTRENNATPYGIGDVISPSAGSPVLIEFPNFFRVAGGSAYITQVAVVFNVKSVTPILRVHFYNSSNPTISGDNLLRKELYADASKRLRYVDLQAMATAADTANSDMSRGVSDKILLPVVAAGGSRSLFVELETTQAVTLTAQSKVTIVLSGDLH